MHRDDPAYALARLQILAEIRGIAAAHASRQKVQFWRVQASLPGVVPARPKPEEAAANDVIATERRTA